MWVQVPHCAPFVYRAAPRGKVPLFCADYGVGSLSVVRGPLAATANKPYKPYKPYKPRASWCGEQRCLVSALGADYGVGTCRAARCRCRVMPRRCCGTRGGGAHPSGLPQQQMWRGHLSTARLPLVRRAEALGIGFWRRLRRCRPQTQPAEALGIGFWRRLRRSRPPLSQPNAPKQPLRSSTTADVSRGKVAVKLRRLQGSGLVSMTAEDNAI